jgi:membrane-bound lytic murein transglycosylase B
MTEAQPLPTWADLGVTLSGGTALPAAALEASLVRGDRRSFLVYANYQALLGYNCSNAYALSVGLLADRIAGL